MLISQLVSIRISLNPKLNHEDMCNVSRDPQIDISADVSIFSYWYRFTDSDIFINFQFVILIALYPHLLILKMFPTSHDANKIDTYAERSAVLY